MTYFYHKLRIPECFKIRYECTQGLSQLGVLVSFVGKDRVFRKLYQKIAQCCDVLQILIILWRFGGNIESLVSVES